MFLVNFFLLLFVCFFVYHLHATMEESYFHVMSNCLHLHCSHHLVGICASLKHPIASTWDSIHSCLTVHSSNTALKAKLPHHYFIITLERHNIIYFQNILRYAGHLETET